MAQPLVKKDDDRDEEGNFTIRRHLVQIRFRSDSRRLILVDTLAFVRKLEANGLPTNQAEVITEAFKEVQNDSYDNVSHNFASKVDMEKCVMMLESNSSKFESKVKSSVLRFMQHLRIDHTPTREQSKDLRVKSLHSYTVQGPQVNSPIHCLELSNQLDTECV